MTTDTTDYASLIERLEKGSGEDRGLDLDLARAAGLDVVCMRHNRDTGENEPFVHWRYTGSLDAALAFAAAVLPGWTWRVASCSVSDDAWIVPDFNHPKYGEAFMARYPDAAKRDPVEWFGTDVDLRPPGRPSCAMLIAVLRALAKEHDR